MKKKHIKLFFIALFFASMWGCATPNNPKYHVLINSISAPSQAKTKSYFMVPGNKGETWNDLQFREYATDLVGALKLRGFYPAKDTQSADILIILSYGVGPPERTQYNVPVPIFGRTGVSSSFTNGQISSFGGVSTFSGTTTYTPTYGIKGFIPITKTRTTYLRYAIISAYDFNAYRKSKSIVELWRTTITSYGPLSDLRRVFPVLISAAVPYLGKNTGRQLSVDIREKDKIVKWIERDFPKK